MRPPDGLMVDGAPLVKATGNRWVDVGLIVYGRAFEHPSKIRIVKWLIRHLAANGIEVRHAGGTVVAIDPDDYIGWQIFKTGCYEPASLALALRIMAAEPGLFVDVGAHFGWYSLAVARIRGAAVIGIEADSGSCAALRANIARNGLRNVTVCNMAVGSEPALLAMSRRAPGNSGTVAVHAGELACGTAHCWVAATRLQTLLERLVQPPVRPVLLKIDIEGFEPQALAGLDFDGRFRPKNILMEYEPQLLSRRWQTRDDVTAFFSARGYVLHDVLGSPIAGSRALPESNVWARDCDQPELPP